MAKKKTLHTWLNQPVHPVLSAFLIALVYIGMPLLFYVYNPAGSIVALLPNDLHLLFPPPAAPTPTLAPGQKAVYTFYIQSAASHKYNRGMLTLTPSDTGKRFTLDLGNIINLERFGAENYHIAVDSPQSIFTGFGYPISIFVHNRTGDELVVQRVGFGTISISELDPALLPTPTPPVHTTYTSRLGISFSYIPFVPNGTGQYFFTREIDNTIYLYWVPGANQPFSGTDEEFIKTTAGGSYSVEVFNKDPKLSLIYAIRQQFLTGYSDADCFVKTTGYGHPRVDESYQTAIIDFFHPSKLQTREQLDALVAKCPKYVTAYGVSYFMMDPMHPNKLLFVKLGQDNMPAGVKGSTWDGTIKVLE